MQKTVTCVARLTVFTFQFILETAASRINLSQLQGTSDIISKNTLLKPGRVVSTHTNLGMPNKKRSSGKQLRKDLDFHNVQEGRMDEWMVEYAV